MDDPTAAAILEEQQWQERGWNLQRAREITRLKGTVAGVVSKRLAAYEWAMAMVDHVERADREGDCRPGSGMTISGAKLAAWFEAEGIKSPVRPGSKRPETIGAKRANDLRYVDAMMIDLAVLECRTLMTARALSADFEGETLGDLEAKYVKIIAGIMRLGWRLRNRSTDGTDFLEVAQREAIKVAAEQRSRKPVTMAARERFWRDREAPLRKVFESSHRA